MVISGLVATRAKSPGMMKQRIPKYLNWGESLQERASMRRPRMRRIIIDLGHPGAVKIYRDMDSILTALSALPC
jgi:hypothetical protein